MKEAQLTGAVDTASEAVETSEAVTTSATSEADATSEAVTTSEADATSEAVTTSEADVENGNADVPPPAEHTGDVETTAATEDNAENAAEETSPEEEPAPQRKYQYQEGQWAPHNQQGSKRYDAEFLLQLQNDPLAKIKPDNIPSTVAKTERADSFFSLSSIARPLNSESFLPGFAKTMSPKRGSNIRDMKKSNSMVGKPITRGGGPGAPTPNKIIRLSLSLQEDIKLNQTKNAWKPSSVKKEIRNSKFENEDEETQELYKNFRGILNKLTPQKFDKLVGQVKDLKINTQSRLKGVIDLVFEKAIEEPSFSEAYASLCEKLSTLAVPSDNANEQLVNFRVLLIHRCQAQFETTKVDEAILNLEKEIEACDNPAKKKELQLHLHEENRKVRMRSVGNIRFIGELYKLKMLIPKIMVHCMNHLINKLEEENLECLCKLLSTIGQQVEGEAKSQLDAVFKRMQDIIEKSKKGQTKISSRVRFMLQDTIELRQRKWANKNLIQAGPKTIDQIQKEAEQQHREIEIMNSGPVGNDRRGGRDSRDGRDGGRRGDSRRGGSSNYSDWPQTTQTKTKFVVDAAKIKAGVNNSNKNISNIKLGPPTSMWNQGSGAKPAAPAKPLAPAAISNRFSVLDTGSDNAPIPPPYQPKGSSMDKPPIRIEFSGGKSASNEGVKPAPPVAKPEETAVPVSSEPLTEKEKTTVHWTIDSSLSNPDDEELAMEIKEKFPPPKHAAVVTEIINFILEKPMKTYAQLSKSLHHLVSTKTVSPGDFFTGLTDVLEFAPDIYIDFPKLYDCLALLIAPHLISKHITLQQVLKAGDKIIAEQHGQLFLVALIEELKKSMGPTFVKACWQESGLKLTDWMNDENASKFKTESKFSFLEGEIPETPAESHKTPQETQQTLLHLMTTDQTNECILGWIRDNIGKATNEDWFMRVLIKAICEYALFGVGERSVPRFNQERMAKYIHLINDFGADRDSREMNCLLGIQQLLHKLEHPRGVTLEIFQYLSENYIITREAFLAFETSELEPEGKAVLLKALVSFYTDIKEVDNEDSGSED